MKLAQSLIVGFAKFIVAQVPRSENQMVDALANIASSALYSCHVELNIMAHPSISKVAILTTELQEDCSWISPISSYLRNRTLPEDRSEVEKVKARVARYTFIMVFCIGDHFLDYTRGACHPMRQNV